MTPTRSGRKTDTSDTPTDVSVAKSAGETLCPASRGPDPFDIFARLTRIFARLERTVKDQLMTVGFDILL